MINPIQNPGISHQLNQAHLSVTAKQEQLKKEKEERFRKEGLADQADGFFWKKVAKAFNSQSAHFHSFREGPEDLRVFSDIQGILDKEGSSRKMIELIATRISKLRLSTPEEVYARANYYFAPYCPPLNANKLRRQFYMTYLKHQKDQIMSAWVVRAQDGDSSIYRHLLYQLRLILMDFFERHFKGQFGMGDMSDAILILVDKALPTYSPKESFFTWFFAIVKAKLTHFREAREGSGVLRHRNVSLSESKLAYLAIQHSSEGTFL